MSSTTTTNRKQKKTKDWYEDKAREISLNNVDSKLIAKYDANYNIYNGRGKLEDFNDYSTFMKYKEEGQSGININRHFDILSSIASAQVGDEEKRPFKPLAVDVSLGSSNELKRAIHKKISTFIHDAVQRPILEQIEMEMQGASPEEIQKAQQQAEENIPEDVKKFMFDEYKTSGSILGQKIMEFYIRKLDLKFLFNQGFKNFIITGNPVFYAGIYNDALEVELIDPKGFVCGGGSFFFIEDADWWKYERGMTINEVYRRYSAVLTKEDMDALDDLINTNTKQEVQENPNVVHEFSANPKLVENLDILDKDHQVAFQREVVKALSKNSDTLVTHTHCVWRSVALFKYITRMTEEGETGFFTDGSYVFNPLLGDIEEREEYIPQLYQTTILSLGGKDVFINKGPLPGQHLSINDPRDIKGPYYGIYWGSFFENSKFLAPLDKGKPHQYDYNIVRSKLTKIIAENKGKVLITTYNAKPDNWDWEKWMGYVDDGILIVDTTNLNPSDAQLFKHLDLSSTKEIADTINYLETIKQEAAQAMSYNLSRLGQISPYMTATNNQQNIVQSMSQTEDIYYTYRLVKERFLTYILRLAKVVHKENKVPLSYVLDDYSLASLEINEETLDCAEWGVFISGSQEDQDNLIMAKNYIHPMAQSGAMGFSDVIKAQWSSSHMEILNAAKESEIKMQEKEQQAQQAQAQQAQAQQEALMQRLKMDMDHEIKMFELKADLELKLKEIDSMKYANQYDIDKDLQNDQIEVEKLKIEHEKEENKKDRELKKFELKYGKRT